MPAQHLGQMPSILIDRRQFSITAALALLGGAAITIGCGGANPTGPTPPPPAAPGNVGVAGSVGGNHAIPHIAMITAAQLTAGAGITLDISNGLHTHSVVITSAQVGQIAAQARVSVASSTDPHSNGTDPHQHLVTFN